MSSELIVTILVAAFAGSVASIIRGMFGMPKLRAEARVAGATGEVSISGDAREWAKTFADRAEKAEGRAEKAEGRAERAEAHADELDTRCDELEAKLVKLANYTRLLRAEMVAMNGNPPPIPADLSPPL